MSEVYRFSPGEQPLLVSIPHDGREIPADIRERMTETGRSIPDTDWHVAKLYDFATKLDANVIAANYSRYVVDLNRPANDASLYPGQLATGLCPEKTFAGESIYRGGGVSAEEKRDRIVRYWRPYHQRIHDTLSAVREHFGYALLWDAHSIPSYVPSLFDGELPALNLGSNAGKSCAAELEAAVAGVIERSGYSSAINGRFKGGYITRNYGDPANGVQALQLEISQRAYMNESSGKYDAAKAAELRDTLRELLRNFLQASTV